MKQQHQFTRTSLAKIEAHQQVSPRVKQAVSRMGYNIPVQVLATAKANRQLSHAFKDIGEHDTCAGCTFLLYTEDSNKKLCQKSTLLGVWPGEVGVSGKIESCSKKVELQEIEEV